MKIGLLGINTITEMCINICTEQFDSVDIFLFDDDESKKDEVFFGYNVGGSFEDMKSAPINAAFICLGEKHLKTKKKLWEQIDPKLKCTNLIHPTAQVELSAQLGFGNIIGPKSYIGRNTSLGQNNVFWANVCAEHDCNIGDHNYFGPSVTLSGFTTIQNACLVGTGAITLPESSLGNYSTLGAGAVLLNQGPPNSTLVGNPAKPIQKS